MKFHLLHPRDQLVTIMNRIYHNRMTTLSGGNLSVLDEDGSLWITPAGVDKGRLRPEDIIHVRPDGAIVGPHRPSSEYPFHRAIYARRPDLRAVVHAHPPALVSFSIVRRVPDTSIIPQAQRVCGPVGYAPYALPGSEELGAAIAATFARGFNVVLLENHGIATGGPDLLTAFQRLETLDFCARTLLSAQRLGPVKTLTEEQLALLDTRCNYLPEFVPLRHSSREREMRQQVVETVHRACERYLMISTEGVVSARVDEQDFVITPTGMDRGSLEIEDLVLISDGRRESGKLPSRSVCMHMAIYRTHPAVNCIITAQSPHATAYAITGVRFDTRVIPESALLLRDVPIVPYGVQFLEPQRVADAIAGDTVVLLIQNDAILTVGNTVLEAFDRLEVAEFSARALIEAQGLGEFTPIGEQEVDELKAFLAQGKKQRSPMKGYDG
ncbi:MAG: class II aldolase/adducin family protein [Anaerolineae bacterium]|nr:class II aldolase/adducin family protein [Anaerolineae bacterium]